LVTVTQLETSRKPYFKKTNTFPTASILRKKERKRDKRLVKCLSRM